MIEGEERSNYIESESSGSAAQSLVECDEEYDWMDKDEIPPVEKEVSDNEDTESSEGLVGGSDNMKDQEGHCRDKCVTHSALLTLAYYNYY